MDLPANQELASLRKLRPGGHANETQIAAMLAASGKAGIEFYKAAFGATVLWDLDGLE